MGRIFNIPASLSAVDVLAEKFLAEYAQDPLALSDVLMLLPNRRAAKALSDAFVRQRGLVPTLLPKMVPIGDVEEDELFLTGFDFSESLTSLAPAIERNERLLLFTKIILSKPTEFGLEKMSANQACYLAQELASLIDTAHNENLSFDKLKDLVPAEYATHWQETLKFLEIITKFWPEILRERGLIDPAERRNSLIAAQAEMWKKNPPNKRICVIGTTATFPAMKELVAVVLSLSKGEVYLSGLDKFLDDESWAVVDETHPQFELKDLLAYLKIERENVENLLLPQNEAREKFISEIMRPAKTTDKWRDIAQVGLYHEAYDGISLINCADVRQEALAIALIMRESLETPEKTTALVTTDRSLARRVASELWRWNIKVDDSAGCPLASLLKLPLAAGGCSYAEIRRLVRDYEKKVLRSGFADEVLDAKINKLKDILRPLYDLMGQPKADFKQLLEKHIKVAEAFAALPDKKGADVLWRGDDGEAMAAFVADLYQSAEVLGEIETAEYAGLLDAMMASITVRPKYGTHPRLKILGPIEARLTHFDTIIIGEVNEGAFPKATSADPWMSRPPVEARPRVMSASAVENWMRDPYIIYAKYILKLKKLDDLEQDLSLKDYGTIIHAVLEKFNNKYATSFPPNAKEELLALGREYFNENQIAMETRAFWWPAFEKTVDWLIGAELKYRPEVKQVHNEVEGSFSFEAPAGKFTITAKADRVDETKDGKINIIDYKTGRARSKKEVETGKAPQLPIEGLIAQAGGFAGIDKKAVAELIYWQLGRKETVIGGDMEATLNRNLENIAKLINLFDFEDTPYLSRPNPKNVPEYSDYEHLARVKEWSVVESDAEE